ncbi:MAG: hypothetical protein DRH37_01625 [Deltaproteobacteria bacterium]|nr:MAG: hypothetical protein DRH37_01625 [Deltaproteobacteria bacterium]
MNALVRFGRHASACILIQAGRKIRLYMIFSLHGKILGRVPCVRGIVASGYSICPTVMIHDNHARCK